MVNYADPGSGDELGGGEEDDDSGDDDFTGSRIARRDKPMLNAQRASGANASAGVVETETQQSYLGRQPPSKLITTRIAQPAKHQY